MSDRRPALLYVGRVSKEKQLLTLPAVQDRLHAIGVEHRFVIVGGGPLLSELQARMPDAVFTGPLSRDAVAEAFASSDLFVFPSRTDTAGNVVLEAQASGLPVVISGTGGPRENMIAGQTGNGVPPRRSRRMGGRDRRRAPGSGASCGDARGGARIRVDTNLDARDAAALSRVSGRVRARRDGHALGCCPCRRARHLARSSVRHDRRALPRLDAHVIRE